MANLGDYGTGNYVQGMTNLWNTASQANQRKIENQKNQFALEQMRKQEEMLDKDVMFGGFLEAKGVNPLVKDRTLKYGQGLGYIDPVGRVKMRNMPHLLKALSEDKEYQMGVLEDNHSDVSQKMSQMDEEITKVKEKNPDWMKDPEVKKQIMMREQLNVKQYNLKNAMDKLTGAKKDTSVTEAEILTLPDSDPRKNSYIQGKQKLIKPKAPTVHTFTEGDRTVEKQWNEETNAWDTLSTAPRYKPSSGGSGGITPYQQIRTATDLRKEFNNRPEVKEFNQIMPKITSIDKALQESKGPNKVAADQAIITLFNKMTDPNSVVRESEYARTPENLATLNRLKGKVQKVMSGGAGLTDTDRQAIVRMAKQMKGAYQEVFNTVADEYTDYATGYRIDPTLVIGERRKTTQPSGIDKNAIAAELARRKGK